MKFSRIYTARRSLILLPLLLTFGTKSAIAQITPSTDGIGTIVQTQNNQLNISGGTQAGRNQFHSFQQFGVNTGQTANFITNSNIANILGRVTGGETSLINGILQVSGSNANLYLINPSGIVFGKDASLNIPAAFTATTANGIGFGPGNWFNAIGSNNYATLTANPTSFGFVGTSGSLVNAGNLTVNPGQSIALVGGTVVNTGTITAPGGDITIAAIPGEKMVRIGQAGTVLSLDLPTSDRVLINAPTATPLLLPALLTGGSIPSAMGVVVEDGVIKLTGGSASINGTLNADGKRLQNGGNVIAYADHHLTIGGTIAAKGGELGGNGGFVETSGKGTIVISPNAKVLTTAVKGLTGTWLIDPADLEVVAGTGGTIGGAGSTIGANTIVKALDGTNINLQADKSITVNAAIDASGNTNPGNLTLTAPTANLNRAITLTRNSTLNGTATTVNVGATGTVQNGVDVAVTGGIVKLGTATYTLGQTVEINKNVTLQGAGASKSIVSGNDSVRVFNIGSGSTVMLDAISIVKGRSTGMNDMGNTGYGGDSFGGGIYNDGGTLTVSNSTISGNSSLGGSGSLGAGNGAGGGIYNAGGTLTVSNSTISDNSSKGGNGGSGSGFGGGIYNMGGTVTVNNSNLSNNSSSGGNGGDGLGGGIFSSGTVTVNNSNLSNNSSSGGKGRSGTGGDGLGGGIFNNGESLTVSNSTLSGNTSSGGDGDGSNGGSGGGGGIYNTGGTVTVNNSKLSSNSSSGGSGGSLSNDGDDSRFGGDGRGGGIYNDFGTLILNNSTLSSNSSKGGTGIAGDGNSLGGGIYNYDTATVRNSTLLGNSAANGGGIYNRDATLTIGSSIVSGNTALKGREIYQESGLFISEGYNILGYSGANGLLGVSLSATDIILSLDRTQNLETPETDNTVPALLTPTPVLCVVGNDAATGGGTCGERSTQSQSDRPDPRKARTDR